jgi:heptosyltransferase III
MTRIFLSALIQSLRGFPGLGGVNLSFLLIKKRGSVLPCAAVSPSTLVSHTGALGDFITCLPALAAWRRLHPGCRGVLLGRPAHAALCAGLFDEVWDAAAASTAGLFSPAGLGPAEEARLSDIERVLLFCGASSPLAANLSRRGAGELLRQDPFPPAGMRGSVVDYHLSLFPRLRFSDADRIPAVGWGAEEARQAGRLMGPAGRTAVLHPGSGSPAKNWPAERFREIGRRLAGAGIAVAWVRGPADEWFDPPAGDIVLQGLRLPVLAASLALARVYVGNDSGVSHLAAAAGAPCLALFGATDADAWAPRGRRVRVLDSKGKGTETLTLREVWSECRALFGA